jgi:hypothetical protein
MQVQTALLGALPVCGNALVDVCLVDDLGDQLGAVGDGARVGGWEFAAQNGILATGGDEQAEQGPDAVDGKAEHNDGDENEDGDASSHGGRWWWWAVSCCLVLLFPRRAGLDSRRWGFGRSRATSWRCKGKAQACTRTRGGGGLRRKNQESSAKEQERERERSREDMGSVGGYAQASWASWLDRG